MIPHQQIIPLINKLVCSFVVLLFLGCSWSDQPSEDEFDDQTLLLLRNIHNQVNFANFGSGLKKDNSFKAYQRAFTWKSGSEAQGETQLSVKMQKFEDHLELFLTVAFSEDLKLTSVYNSTFERNEVAEYLDIDAVFTDSRSNQKFKLVQRQNVSADGEFAFTYFLDPSDFNYVKSGLANFTVSFDSEFSTFFGVPSKIHPFHAEIQFDYQVPIVYKSILYFKNLTLNEATVRELLGDNDWDNSTPEAGILVECNDQTVLYDYTKNSFTHSNSQYKEFYHTSEDDFLQISILDVDYGFNANDLIRDTVILLKELEGTDYHDLKMRYVENLLMYTQFKGRVN